MSLAISIFGLGYVGSVTAACFAQMGHRVVGVDVNPLKVEMLESGRSPIVEAEMSSLVAENNRTCRLHATNDFTSAVAGSDVTFICVGTPSLSNGKLDLGHIKNVAHQIGTALKKKESRHVIVVRSTVLPGTTESVLIPIIEEAGSCKAGDDFSVCYNPEFMREGSAVADFMQPPYTVLGAGDPSQLSLVRELYSHIPAAVFETSILAAEMVKYVSNTFHALKISFANEIGTLCKELAVDTQAVMRIFTADSKLNISSAYLSPAFAFGGSCLPKDLRALSYRAKELDLNLPLLGSIMPSNTEHLCRAAEAIFSTKKRRISVLGLSFKPGTDDLRESPQVQLIKRLLGEGLQVQVWDEDVSLGKLAGSNRQYIENVIPHIGSLLSQDFDQVVSSGEVVVLATRSFDIQKLAQKLTTDQIVIDLVNVEALRKTTAMGAYHGICW
jgi:GDP-mannose 6-dehydrogenase